MNSSSLSFFRLTLFFAIMPGRKVTIRKERRNELKVDKEEKQRRGRERAAASKARKRALDAIDRAEVADQLHSDQPTHIYDQEVTRIWALG